VKGLPAVDDWHFIDLGDEEAPLALREDNSKGENESFSPRRQAAKKKFRLVLAFLAALRLCEKSSYLPRPWRAYFEVAAGLASIAFL
jgi:hypothetical protein